MAKRTRRQFLEESMFATAAALAGSGTSVLARQANGRGSANDTINVAIVGAGSRGGAHVGGYTNPALNTKITYVCDPDSAPRQTPQSIAKRQGGLEPKLVADLRRALDDKNVHVVSIAAPNHWHSLAAIWAMQAGKDVYVEKPISHNVSEGRRVVEASTKLGRICQSGTQNRSNPATADAIAYIKSGGIGEVLVSRGLCYKRRPSIGPKGTYPVPATVDYDLWCGPAPKDPLTRRNLHYDWHWVWATGNGDLGNQGIHQMDIARWALGENRLPDAVISYGGRVGYEDAGETANTQVVMMPYGTRSIIFEVRGLPTPVYKGGTVGNIVEGTNGYVLFTSGGASTAFDKDGKPVKTFSGQNDAYHFTNFISTVRNRKREELKADCLEGHLSSACCQLGNVSYRLGEPVTPDALVSKLKTLKVADNILDTFERTRHHLAENDVDIATTKLTLGPWLTIDPKAERFVGNDKANEQLTRPYRAPYVVPANMAAI
jgi:predicted dehydrogenase